MYVYDVIFCYRILVISRNLDDLWKIIIEVIEYVIDKQFVHIAMY